MISTSQPNKPESEGAKQLEPLLNEREYSRIVRRSLASIRRDRLLGKGCPYIKVGALVRYRPCDIRVFIEKNLQVGSGE
jgi:hypothetical protein